MVEGGFGQCKYASCLTLYFFNEFQYILGVLSFSYVYKTVYKKKEDCTYAKRDEKGVSDSLSQ